MKKYLVAALPLVGAFGAFAEDAQTGLDLSPATSFLTSLSTSLSTWIQTNAPVIFTVAGSLLVFWLVGLILRVIKGLGNKAK